MIGTAVGFASCEYAGQPGHVRQPLIRVFTGLMNKTKALNYHISALRILEIGLGNFQVDLGIMKTRPCNVYPLTSHFYRVSLGFKGVYIFFLIFALKHRLWVLVRTASMRRF